jgi:HEAT repeat protein
LRGELAARRPRTRLFSFLDCSGAEGRGILAWGKNLYRKGVTMRAKLLVTIALGAFALSMLGSQGAEKPKDPPKIPSPPPKPDPEKSRKEKLGGKNFDEWKKDLTSADPAVVENAIRTIVFYGDLAKGEAMDILIAKLNPRKYYNLDTSIKVNVVIAIGTLGVDSSNREEATDALIRALSDEQALVRFQAALALGAIGRDGAKAIDKLLLKLKDHSTWEVRKACARALSSVALPAKDDKYPESRVIEGLRYRASNDTCFQVRLEAVQSLIALGLPKPANEQTILIRTLKSIAERDYYAIQGGKEKEDKTVRIWAQVALMRMEVAVDKEQYVKSHARRLDWVGKLLTDPILGVRCQAARALGQMGSYAKSQVEKLAEVLEKDKDPIMVGWTVWAIAAMGKEGKPAIPALERLKKESKDEGFKNHLQDVIDHILNPKLNTTPVRKEEKVEKEKVDKKDRRAR